MKKLYCDMDGVLVDFAAGALELVNTALKNPKYASWKECEVLVERLAREERENILPVDLEKPEYRGRQQEEVMPEARSFMKALITEAGATWWATLPWMPGGKKLWTNIAKYNPRILSAPMDPLDACEKGKQEWINVNLVPIHQPKEVVFTDEKFHLAEGNILIDDFEINIIPWGNRGGLPVLHENTNSTIKLVEEIIEDATVQ
jgi:5'(3')-deoxyribonucleotidase